VEVSVVEIAKDLAKVSRLAVESEGKIKMEPALSIRPFATLNEGFRYHAPDDSLGS
jgi:hypothetical protein